MNFLRVAAFAAYLGALVVLVLAVLAGFTGKAREPSKVTWGSGLGTVLQLIAAWWVARVDMGAPLAPGWGELVGVLVLAPASAWVFLWVQMLGRNGEGLVMTGPYAWMRHPMYAALLGMLVATGLVVHAGVRVLVGVAIFGLGSELRIAAEERELAARYGDRFAEYRNAVRRAWVR